MSESNEFLCAKYFLMEYVIDKTTLYDLIDEEVSRMADRAYAEDGTSLYDAVRILDRDADMIDRMVSDSVSTLVSRFRNVLALVSTESGVSLSLYLPDMEETMQPVAYDELTRFLVMQTVALWSQLKSTQEYEGYVARATAALDKAEMALLTRRRPTR